MLTDDDITGQLSHYFRWLDGELDSVIATPPMPAVPIHPRSGRFRLAAAASLLAVLVGGLMWSATRDSAMKEASVLAPSLSVDIDDLAAVSPVAVPDSAELRAAVNSAVGRFEVYDDVAAAMVYLFLRRPDIAGGRELIQGGLLSAEEVADGSWSVYGEDGEERLAYGLFPLRHGYSVNVAGELVLPDEHGIWFAVLEPGVSEFTINRPDGSITVPEKSDRMPGSLQPSVTVAGPASTTPSSDALAATPSEVESPAAQLVLIGDQLGGPVGDALTERGWTIDERFVGLASSGLARPDFYNWPATLPDMLNRLPAGLPIVVSFGGNDHQLLTNADGTVASELDGPQWEQQYTARVHEFMTSLTQAGHPVIWIGVNQPGQARTSSFADGMATIRQLTIAAAQSFPSVTYIDPWMSLTAVDGKVDPTSQLADGYHLSSTGAATLAESVSTALTDAIELAGDTAADN